MRLCANENIPDACVAALRAHGHDVNWIRETMAGATDEQVMSATNHEECSPKARRSIRSFRSRWPTGVLESLRVA